MLVLVNGSPTSEFVMKRGLRQRDPLSPFSISYVAEGFHVLVEKMLDLEKFRGFKFDNQSDQISHLQYTDDTLIIGAKSWYNVRTIKADFKLFEMISNLKVDFHKSLLVGINISHDWLEVASKALNCQCESSPSVYLGLPIGANPRRLIT